MQKSGRIALIQTAQGYWLSMGGTGNLSPSTVRGRRRKTLTTGPRFSVPTFEEFMSMIPSTCVYITPVLWRQLLDMTGLRMCVCSSMHAM